MASASSIRASACASGCTVGGPSVLQSVIAYSKVEDDALHNATARSFVGLVNSGLRVKRPEAWPSTTLKSHLSQKLLTLSIPLSRNKAPAIGNM